MQDVQLTLKDGTPYIFTVEEQANHLGVGESTEPPEAGTYERKVFDDMFTARGLDVPDAATINAQIQSNNSSTNSRPEYRTRESYFYEQALLDSLDDATVFSDLTSPDKQRRLNATTDLALYRFMEQSQGGKQAQNAVDVDIAYGIPSLIGRELTPQERAALTAKKQSDEILETTEPYAHRLPLDVITNPVFQKLVDPQTMIVLGEQYKAEHPNNNGFWGDVVDGWRRSRDTSEIKRSMANDAVLGIASDGLANMGYDGLASLIAPDEERYSYADLQQQITLYNLTTNDNFASSLGEAFEGMTAPYRDWKGLGLMALSAFAGGGRAAQFSASMLGAVDYFQTNSVDIAYQAATLNPDLQDDGAFYDSIIKAAPESALGSLAEFVEIGAITNTMGRPIKGLYNKLKSSAATSPAINKAAGKMADKIESNADKYKGSLVKAITPVAVDAGKTYLQAVGVQSVTAAAQGALTQEGANRIAGVDGPSPVQAGVDAVRDNMGVILTLSAIPAGLSGLNTALHNRQTTQDLKEHSDRAEMEAATSATPVVDNNPAAAELLFSLTQGKTYRFSAYDLKKQYEAMGLTPDQFRSRYEMSKGDFDGLEELAESGGDIEMSKAHWDAYYAPQNAKGRSEIYDFFNPYLRSGTEHLTLDELKDRLTPESMERMSNDVIQQINDENLTDALAAYIRNDTVSKMQQAGVGRALEADYLSLLNANLFKNLEQITGIDGKELYDRYGAAFAKTDESLNLSGRATGTERLSPEGGAYAQGAGQIILGDQASVLTMFHEWGHYYLDTLVRMASDEKLAPETRARIDQNLSDIKKALGYEPAHVIDEQLQERFSAALIASLVGDRKDLDPRIRERELKAKLAQERKDNAGKQDLEPSTTAETAAKLLFAPDLSRYNKTFARLKRMVVGTLYRNYGKLKSELDAENTRREAEYNAKLAEYNQRKQAAESAGNEFTEQAPVLNRIDVAKELALEEYRERFERDGQTGDVSNLDVTHNMRDVITSQVLGEIAFQKHASLGGLHSVFDAAMLRDLDESLAKEAGDIADEILDTNEELRSNYVKMAQLALDVLRRGARGIEDLKQKLIDNYFDELNQENVTQDRINASLDKAKKDAIKADLETNGPVHITNTETLSKIDAAAKAAAEKKTESFTKGVVNEANKQASKQRQELTSEVRKEFDAADKLAMYSALANEQVEAVNKSIVEQQAARVTPEKVMQKRVEYEELYDAYARDADALDGLRQDREYLKKQQDADEQQRKEYATNTKNEIAASLGAYDNLVDKNDRVLENNLNFIEEIEGATLHAHNLLASMTESPDNYPESNKVIMFFIELADSYLKTNTHPPQNDSRHPNEFWALNYEQLSRLEFMLEELEIAQSRGEIPVGPQSEKASAYFEQLSTKTIGLIKKLSTKLDTIKDANGQVPAYSYGEYVRTAAARQLLRYLLTLTNTRDNFQQRAERLTKESKGREKSVAKLARKDFESKFLQNFRVTPWLALPPKWTNLDKIKSVKDVKQLFDDFDVDTAVPMRYNVQDLNPDSAKNIQQGFEQIQSDLKELDKQIAQAEKALVKDYGSLVESADPNRNGLPQKVADKWSDFQTAAQEQEKQAAGGGATEPDKGKVLDDLNANLAKLSHKFTDAESKALGKNGNNRQPPLFKAQWEQNGEKVQLVPITPPDYLPRVQELAAVGSDGAPALKAHRPANSALSYSSFALDSQKLKDYASQAVPAVEQDSFDAVATPEQKAQAKEVYDAAYKAAAGSENLRVTLDNGQTATVKELARQEREQRADAYVAANRERLETETRAQVEQERAARNKNGPTPEEIKPFLAFLDKLKNLDAASKASEKLRQRKLNELGKNPAWHVLRFLNAVAPEYKLSFEELQKVFGERIAGIMLRNGSAARSGSLTLESLGAGPAKMALGAVGDQSLEKYVVRSLNRMLSGRSLAALGITDPSRLTDFAKGRIVAMEMAKMYTNDPNQIVDQQVTKELLTKSRATAIDTLNYNPNMVQLAANVLGTVGKKEIALIGKIQKAVTGRANAGTETDLKRLSDSIINRHSIMTFDIVGLQRIAGRARDKAQLLASTMLDDQSKLNQITELLTIDAVNKMAAHDGAKRLETLGSNVDRLKKFLAKGNEDLAKSYDVNHVLIMRVAASRMGIISRIQGDRAETALREYAPSEVIQLLDQIEQDRRFSGDYKSMPIPQLESALMTLVDLKDYSKALAVKRNEDTARDYASKAETMLKEWSKRHKQEQPLAQDGKAQSWGISPVAYARRWIGSTFRTYLLKTEQWCEIMDRGPDGVTKELIYNPVRDAYNRSIKDRNEATQAFASVLETFQKECTLKVIDAPELRLQDGSHIVFGKSKGYENRGSWELVGFLMHIGNKSNFDKLLKGKGIEPADFQKFFDRGVKDGFITKPMMDALQKLWDANTEPFKRVQQSYYQIYGHYVKDIPSREIVTPWGTYRGGYVPAIPDRNIAQRPFDIDGNLDTLMQGNVLKDYLGEPGFLKARVEGYTEPLGLDVTVAMQSTLNVIHYANMIEPVGRIYRMFESPSSNARAYLDAYQPQFYDNNLKPWLSRALRDSASNNPSQSPAMNFLRNTTNAIGLSYMFANVNNAVQGLTNFSVLASRIPASLVLKTLTTGLRHYGDMRKEMVEQSLAMSNRFAAAQQKTLRQMSELAQAKSYQNSLTGVGKLTQVQAKQFMQNHGYFLQTAIQHYIDVVTWHAAREYALQQKKSNAQAVAYADSTVRETQGSQDALDLNNIEAGGPILRMFTQFTSYFNTLLNLCTVELNRTFSSDATRLARATDAARVISLAVIAPAIVSDWIAEGFKGNNVFTDSEDWEDFVLNHMFLPSAKMGTAMIPIYGQGLNVVLSDITGTPSYGGLIGTPATVGMFDTSRKFISNLLQGKENNNAWRDGLTVLGVLSGVPVGTAIGRRIDYANTVGIDSLDEALKLFFSGQLSDEEKERYR